MSEQREIAEVLAIRCSKSGDNMSHLLCGELVHRQHYDEADALLDWLAQRDRRVAAEALREAADGMVEDAELWHAGAHVLHPADVLRERAERIERGE